MRSLPPYPSAESAPSKGAAQRKGRSHKIKNAHPLAKVSAASVGSPGFEPRMTEPKPVVLPLHHDPIALQKYALFSNAPSLRRIFFVFDLHFFQNSTINACFSEKSNNQAVHFVIPKLPVADAYSPRKTHADRGNRHSTHLFLHLARKNRKNKSALPAEKALRCILLSSPSPNSW